MFGMEEDALRVALHFRRDHLDRHPPSDGDDHIIAVGHAQIGAPHGDRGHHLRIRPTG